MDPKLKLALPQIIQRVRASGDEQTARELERYLQYEGSTPLSPRAMMVAEPWARGMGVTLVPGQPAPGAPRTPVGAVSGPKEGSPSQGENATLPAPVAPAMGAGAAAGARAVGLNPASAPGVPGSPQVPQIPRTPSIAELQPHDNQGGGSISGIGGTGSGPGGAALKTEVPTNTGAPNSGNFGAFQGDYLSRDDEMLKRFAMQQAGFNPDIMSRGTKIAQGALSPIMQALRAAYGANDPTKSTQGLPDFLAQAAKGYTDKGNDFYSGLRNYAQGVLGGDQFGGFLGGISDQDEKFQMLQTLVPLLYGGANPMIQQSVGDQLGALFGKFHDDEFYGGKPNTLSDFLGRTQSTLSPALQQLFGPLLKK